MSTLGVKNKRTTTFEFINDLVYGAIGRGWFYTKVHFEVFRVHCPLINLDGIMAALFSIIKIIFLTINTRLIVP